MRDVATTFGAAGKRNIFFRAFNSGYDRLEHGYTR